MIINMCLDGFQLDFFPSLLSCVFDIEYAVGIWSQWPNYKEIICDYYLFFLRRGGRFNGTIDDVFVVVYIVV